jgi:hypothetical protein
MVLRYYVVTHTYLTTYKTYNYNSKGKGYSSLLSFEHLNVLKPSVFFKYL